MLGRIHSIQTLGTVDGPGVRFVLFMQGCPLRCGYCHNPDTWDINGGTEVSAQEIFNKVIRFKGYFGKKGGITVSGGEPLLQADFVRELFELCKTAGINTALDTSGCVWNESTEKLLEVTDLCLLDYKMTNKDDYKNHIGCDIEKVVFFMERLQQKGIATWLRHVVVKGITDSDEDISCVNDFARAYSVVKKIELLPFHKICFTKYEEMGIEFKFGDIDATDNETIDRLYKKIDSAYK